jgi:hypothetical protein
MVAANNFSWCHFDQLHQDNVKNKHASVFFCFQNKPNESPPRRNSLFRLGPRSLERPK